MEESFKYFRQSDRLNSSFLMLSAVSVALYFPGVARKIHQVEELQQIHEAAVEVENYLLGLTLPAWLSTKLLLEDNMQQKRTVLLARISPSVPTVIDIDDEGEGGEREEAQEEPNLRVGPVQRKICCRGDSE